MADQCYQESLPEFMQQLFNGSDEDVVGETEQTLREICLEHAFTVKEIIVNELVPTIMIAREDPKLLAIAASLIFVLLLLVIRYLFCSSSKKIKGHDQLSPSDSNRALADNKSVSSLSSPTRERLATYDSQSQRQSERLANPAQVAIRGPTGASLKYETWTPPTPWTDASKQLLPTNAKMKSQVTEAQLELNLQEGNLRIEDTKTSVDLKKVQLHVQRTTGAVLELYIGDNKMEHTFKSAQAAAQFQQDLLAYQIVGEKVMNMYQSLELVHRGSDAHEGKEAVLHDSVGDSEVTMGAVAWDDVFRCLGGAFSGVRAALEMHTLQVGEEEVLASLAPQYQNKRSMLGHVDFFRLFIPFLPLGSQARAEASPARLEKFIDLRKQVAMASLYVQSYVRARCVVNKGWRLEWEQDMKRRLAYDYNMENMKHDAVAKNEYYEAIISRDVLCEVHSKKHLRKHGHSVPSAVQAYSLVGFHTFRLPPVGNDHPLAYDKDPIEAIPSLRRIVERNPELDFFCVGLFLEGPRVGVIKLFVRALPKGVDPHFDKTAGRFAEADAKVRDRKLEVFLQLGPGGGLSPLVWVGIKAVSMLQSWTRESDQQIPVESGGERTQFPGICMSNYMQMHHFGGSLQTNAVLPTNYIAATARVDANQMGNMLSRMLYQRLEDGALGASIVDFSYVLEGHKTDELPERVLGTVRMVHCDPIKYALPVELSAQQEQEAHPVLSIDVENRQLSSTVPPGTHSVKDNAKQETTSWWGFLGHKTASVEQGETKEEEKIPDSTADPRSQVLKDDDGPFRAGIDALIDILDGVQVPVRRASLDDYQLHVATNIPEDQLSLLTPQIRHEDLVNLPVLEKLDRSDLRRYYTACECDLKIAAIRIIESTAWRGITFPINTRFCRIELQSGQFFQQGNDLKGNTVFYFRNMCVGPWRQDADAVIRAVLHRLETSLQKLTKKKPGVKITLVVLLGRPLFKKKKNRGKKKHDKNDDETKITAENTEAGETLEDEDEHTDVTLSERVDGEDTSWNPFKMGVNPRLQASEDYHVHTNPTLIKQLIDTLMLHYPERLHKVIFVPGKSRGYGYWGTAVQVQIAIRNTIQSPRTRSRCFVLHRVGELKEFVHRSEIVTIAGGEAPLHEEVFECK
jgi:hypothetical protein